MANSSYISARAPYYGTSTTLVQDHDVNDIMQAIINKHNKERSRYDQFSEWFWAGDERATAKKIFDYLKGRVTYDVEKPEQQTVKSPGAIVHEGYGDCKHYSSFINGVLASLQRKGYPIKSTVLYRFSGYTPYSNDLHHVFAVLKNGNKEIWIDPVLLSFDNRKSYYAHADKIVSMPLKEINGIPGFGNIFQDIKKGFNNTVKAVTQGAQNTVQAVKQPVMKIAASPARNSFLLLLKVNAFNLAHRLYDFMHRSQAQEQELTKFWKEKIGGNPEALKKNIAEGMQGYLARTKQTAAEYNKKAGFLNGVQQHPNQMQYFTVYCYCFPYHIPGMSDGKMVQQRQIGVEPASAAALMAAAATIIAAMAPILKRSGWSDTDKKNADNVASAGASALSAAAMMQTGGTLPAPASNVILPNGSTQSMLETTVSTAADGTKVITVADNGNLDKVTGGGSTLSDTIKQSFDSIKSFAIENKYILIGTGVLIIAAKSGVFNNLTKKTRKR